MLNKIKNFLTNKKFIAITLFLLISVCFSSLFAVNQKPTNKTPELEVVATNAEPQTKTETFLTLGYTPYKKSTGIRTTGWENVSGSFDSLDYGTKIEISGDPFEITVSAKKDGSIIATKKYTPAEGYYIEVINIFKGDSGNGDIVKEIGLNATTKFSFLDNIENFASYDLSAIMWFSIKVDVSTDYNFTEYELEGYCENTYKTVKFTYVEKKDLKAELPDGYSFWGIEKSLTEYESENGSKYELEVDSVKEMLTISNGALYFLKLHYSDIVTVNKVEYYVIDKILQGSFYSEKLIQGENPLIVAIERTYKAKINNAAFADEEEYHKYVTDDAIRETIITNHTGEEYLIKDVAKDNDIFPFNKGKAFHYQEVTDSDGKIFYVKNYGYEISGWKIDLSLDDSGTTTEKHIEYNSGNWNLVSGKATGGTLCTDVSVSFQSLAQFLDDNIGCSYSESEILSITLTPVWKPAKIKIVNDNDDDNTASITETNTFDYGLGYKIEATSLIGKTFAYCKTAVQNKIIVKDNANDGNAIFNYTTIQKEDFTYEPSGEPSAYYKLAVTPEYLDKIYKVTLNGIEGTNPDICNTDYAYGVNGEEAPEEDSYNYTSNIPDTGYNGVPTYESGLIEGYIAGFTNKIAEYENGIENKAFEILKKVYKNSDDYYIYLANDQLYGTLPYGTLPSFEKSGYENIFFENGATNKKLFKTNLYNGSDDHKMAAKQEYGEDEDYDFDSVDNKKWKQSDGTSLTAYYFRKYYYLEAKTLLASDNKLYGYAKITVNDPMDDYDGNYVAVYYDNAVHFYNCNGSLQGKTLGCNCPTSSTCEVSNVIHFVDPTNPTKLKIYSGCTVTISAIDQSGDPGAVLQEADTFNQMLGFKFKEFAFDDGNVDTSDSSADNNVYTTTYSDGKTGETTTITINFEKINYSFVTRIDDENAGSAQLKNAVGTTLHDNKVDSLNVGSYYTIRYSSKAGFEFVDNDNKFSIEVREKLETGTSTNILKDPDDTTEQVYEMNFDAAWLKVYYNNFNNDCSYEYAVFDSYGTSESYFLGVIQINTKPFKFELGVVYYDETGKMDDKTVENRTNFTLGTKGSENAGKATLDVKIIDLVSNDANIGYYVDLDSKKYALLSSRLYFPDDLSSTIDNYYTSYSFKLTNAKNELGGSMEVDSSKLANMVEDYSNGQIIEGSKRKVYIRLDVREIFEVVVKDEIEDDADPGTKRNVTVSSGKGNSTILTKDDVSKTYYTYKGLNNTISFDVHSLSYESANVELNTGLLGVVENFSNKISFSVEADGTLTITYKPKLLNVTYNYFLYSEGSGKYESQGSNPPAAAGVSIVVNKAVGLKAGDIFKITSFECTGPYSYLLKICGDERYVGYEHTVSNEDYEKGSVEVGIYMAEIANGEILISFATYANNTPYDDANINLINSVKVYQNGSLLPTASRYRIYDLNKVELELDIATGYTFNGINFNGTTNKTDYTFTDSKTTLVESFNPNDNSGSYTIYLNKEAVKATLTVGADNLKIYSIDGGIASNEGATYTLDAFVGKEIEFNVEPANREILNKFFYVSTTGNVDSGFEGTGNERKFTITPEVLESIEKEGDEYILNFGVEGIKRNALHYTVVGEEYLAESITAKVGADDFVMGQYYNAGTQVEFTVNPKIVGKYDVNISGSFVYGSVDELNSYPIEIVEGVTDMTITITISPKFMQHSQKVYVYNSLAELTNTSPTLLFDSTDNAYFGKGDGSVVFTDTTPYYGETQTITIKKEDEKKSIFQIKLNGVEIQQVSGVLYNNKLYTYNDDLLKYETVNTADGYFDADLKYFAEGAATGDSVYCYEIKVLRNAITISYTIDEAVEVDAIYKSYKTISGN